VRRFPLSLLPPPQRSARRAAAWCGYQGSVLYTRQPAVPPVVARAVPRPPPPAAAAGDRCRMLPSGRTEDPPQKCECQRSVRFMVSFLPPGGMGLGPVQAIGMANLPNYSYDAMCRPDNALRGCG